MITLPDTYQLLHFETVDSTNEEAKRLAAQGVVQPHWILADAQSAGRGRRGRVGSRQGKPYDHGYLPGRVETEGRTIEFCGRACIGRYGFLAHRTGGRSVYKMAE